MTITIIKRQSHTNETIRETNRKWMPLNIKVDAKGWKLMKVMMPHISNTLKLNVILDRMLDGTLDVGGEVPDFFERVQKIGCEVQEYEYMTTTMKLNVDKTKFEEFDAMCCEGETIPIIQEWILYITNCFADPIRCGFLLDELQRVICK